MAAPSMGTAQPYRGPSGKIVGDSPWFCYADIPDGEGGDYVVVIEDVLERRGVRFAGGAANEVEMFLKFRGIPKELRVNVSIRRVLDDLFTPQTGEWVGKAIALYVQPGIKVGNDVRSGVRVRNKPVSMPTSTTTRRVAAERAPASGPAMTGPVDAAPGFNREGTIRDLKEAARTGPEVKAAAQRLGFSGKSLETLTDKELQDLSAATFNPL